MDVPTIDPPANIAVANSSESELWVWLEPWGDGLAIAPGTTISILASGHDPVDLLIDVQPSNLLIWAQSGDRVLEFFPDPRQ